MAVDAFMRARFLREARVTGRLQHPGIVPVYELAQRPGETDPFYTMRFIKGRTLTQAARDYHAKREAGRADSLELRELLGAFRSVCQAIAYAHSCGVIHRDLKGQNVALGGYGEVMVLDWGLAKLVGDKPENRSEGEGGAGSRQTYPAGDSELDLTAAGQILGTPSYMSPEQAMGRLDLTDQRSDIYGLGAILYEILTGEPPFRGDNEEVLRKVIEGSPVPPHERVAKTPPALEAICSKCMSAAPGDRYDSADDLAREVECYLAGEPVTAYREPWSVKARRWAGRHKTLATASAAMVFVAMVCFAIATVLLRLSYGRETEARSKAEANSKLAFEAVDRFLTKVGEAPLLKAYGLEKLLQGLLRDAKNFHRRFTLEEAQSRGPRPITAGAASSSRKSRRSWAMPARRSPCAWMLAQFLKGCRGSIPRTRIITRVSRGRSIPSAPRTRRTSGRQRPERPSSGPSLSGNGSAANTPNRPIISIEPPRRRTAWAGSSASCSMTRRGWKRLSAVASCSANDCSSKLRTPPST